MMASDDFRDLYDTYYLDVLRFVQSLFGRAANDTDVDEVVQDVFVKVAFKADSFRGEAQMQTWIFAIARNAVRDHARKSSRAAYRQGPSLDGDPTEAHIVLTPGSYDDPALHAPPSSNPESAILASDERARVRACIDRLPAAMRAVVTCRLLSDLTVPETAAVLGWSQARVRVTHSRALRKFRSMWELGRQGGDGAFAGARASECSEVNE